MKKLKKLFNEIKANTVDISFCFFSSLLCFQRKMNAAVLSTCSLCDLFKQFTLHKFLKVLFFGGNVTAQNGFLRIKKG
jgi:hypothetical protein